MQYTTNISSLTNLLTTAPDLNKLLHKVEQLKQISQFVNSHLEPNLANQCRVANLRDGSLILSTTSPAWNHKLRFLSLDLLSALRSNPNWSGLKSIEIRVDYLPTHENDTTTNLKKPNPLSAYNAKLLRDTANGIANPKLAKSLKRLAAKSAD